MNVGFISLGCSKNLIDTEVAIGMFKDNNYKIVNNPEDADILVIITCGFIESAKEEAINSFLEMAEYKNKRCKYLIAMGCLVQRYYEELVKALPEVDLFIKIDEYDKKHAGYRIRGYNWWDLELPTDGELRNGLDNLCKVNNKVDYIISHCAPTSIQNAFNPYYPDNKLTKYFEEIKDKVEFKKWYFGHYHKNDDTTFDKFACLYEKIIEIK